MGDVCVTEDGPVEESIWLPLALGRRRWDAADELKALRASVSAALPGGPAEESAERFAAAGPGENIGAGLDLIHELQSALALADHKRGIADLIRFAELCLACLGDEQSASVAAVNLLRVKATAFRGDLTACRALVQAAIGWLTLAAGEPHAERESNPPAAARDLGYQIVHGFEGSALNRLKTAEAYRRLKELGQKASDGDEDEDRALEPIAAGNPEAESAADDPETLVVVSAVAMATETGSKDVGLDFDAVNGRRLPLIPTPELGPLREALTAEFPHAVGVVDVVLGDLSGRRSVRLRPTLLVGRPGSGKSRLSRRLCELLGVPYALYPCGGISDSSFAGTARRWSSSEPSLPLRLVRDGEVANPAVLLDELEKSGSGTHNGRLWDALIPLLEHETAARWVDPYIQAPCDLSAFNWVCTANHLHGIPEPLIDRFRVIRVPSPGCEHLPALAASLLADLVRERGLAPGWAEPLDGIELRALRRSWRGGSLRSLRRLVEGVLAARDLAAPRH